MFARTILFFMVIFLISCSIEKTTNGFDSACLIFQEASKKNLSPEDLGSYIAGELDKMEKQPSSEDVKEVYHALFNVDPANRYELFKESAEAALKRNWNCQIMKKLYR